MKDFKNYKLAFIIFSIVYLILSIIVGVTNVLNIEEEKRTILLCLIALLAYFPLIVVLILAYYEKMLAGIITLAHEILVSYYYFQSNPYENWASHFTAPELYLFILIPIAMGSLYLYGYFKYKKKDSKKI